MRLYRRGKSGKWWWEETISKKRYRMSTGVRDKDSAKKIAAKACALIAEDKWLERTKVFKVSALLDRLESDYRLRNKLSAQNRSILAAVREDFGTKMSDELSADFVATYIERRQAEDFAAATINRRVEILRRCLKLAGLKVPTFTKLDENNARSGFFNRDEFNRLSANLPEELRDFCFFAYLTGMRLSEIRSLSWSDVSENVIRLRGENAKTGEPRKIVIAGELVGLIERCRQARCLKTSGGVAMAGSIFHRDGLPIGEFRKSWASACIAAGLGTRFCPKCQAEGASSRCPQCKTATKYRGRIFHDFRRSAVRNLIRAGISQTVTMAISGHKTDAIFRRYDITDETDLAAAMIKLERHKPAESVVAMAQ